MYIYIYRNKKETGVHWERDIICMYMKLLLELRVFRLHREEGFFIQEW